MDWTKWRLDFHSLWGWGQMFSATACLVLFYIFMNRRKVRIIFKTNFYSVPMIGFPSLEILLPHLTGKKLFYGIRKSMSQTVTEVCNISKTAGYFLPHMHPSRKKKRKPGYISCLFSAWNFPNNIHICNLWTDYCKIFQRTFPFRVRLIIWFIFMSEKHLLTKIEHSFRTFK